VAKSFQKHGTYIYEVSETIARYGSAALAIEAMRNAQITHAWVRIHSQRAYPASAKKTIAAFIADLTAAGVAVAGWGWCQGSDPAADAKVALQELASFGLSDYIADIENGVNGAKWDADEITSFCSRVRAGVGGSFGITSFPFIDWHEPELMKAAIPYVDMFNPQVYWHRFPNKKMARLFRRPNGGSYAMDKAADYADLCLDRWDALMGANPKDIVITGQAYWGEGEPPFTQSEAEEKLDEFLGSWTGYGRVIGLNWWHWGGGQSMSHRLLDSIAKAKLGDKSYKAPLEALVA
jgi:hypothetical protein